MGKNNNINDSKISKSFQNKEDFSKNTGEKKFKSKYKKVSTEDLLDKFNLTFSRDAEWFKRTCENIQKTKNELDRKFYIEEKKAQKFDFLRKLQTKIRDYKDSIKYAEKYKKVRFFERRKLERMLTKVNKGITLNGSTLELEEKKNKIVNDINYVKVVKFY